jgi:hypothetical protein
LDEEHRQLCYDCKVAAPVTQTNYTLSTMSWRCVVELDPAGAKVAVWRCPECWVKLRRQEATSPTLRKRSITGALR